MPEDIYPDAGLVPGADDLSVTPQEFSSLPLFRNANVNKLRRCVGAIVLRIVNVTDRKAKPVICRQGAAGVSAYFILSDVDAYGLYAYVEAKLETSSAKLSAASAPPSAKATAFIENLKRIREEYYAKLSFLRDEVKTAQLKAAYEADVFLAERSRKAAKGAEAEAARALLTGNAAEKRAQAAKMRETDPALASVLTASAATSDDTPAALVYRHMDQKGVHARPEAQTKLQATLYEREMFGEMACKNRKPRAADVVAQRPCYVLEMLSNVLEILEEDPLFKKKMQDTYERRILELHLRDFSLFRHLPEDQFMEILDGVRAGIHVKPWPAGTTICKEGDPSDSVYLIRRGWVQIRQGSQQQIIAYSGPGEFIGEMGLIRTDEQIAALTAGDFSGVLQSMPEPGPRSATCVSFGHPNGGGEVELVSIPYEKFWKLIQVTPGIRLEIAAELERRRTKGPEGLTGPDRKSVPELFQDYLAPLGLYQGQSLMLIDLERCTMCNDCVKACVNTHSDGRSRLFLTGPQTVIAERTYLVPTTCQSCDYPVCMIGCPSCAIQRGNKLEININELTCIGCAKCASNCPYNAIQMHDLGLISVPGNVNPRVPGTKGKTKEEPAESADWYFARANNLGNTTLAAWQTQTVPPHGWRKCSLPLHLDNEFFGNRNISGADAREKGLDPLDDTTYFWRVFSVPSDRQDWDGHLVLTVDAPPKSIKVWIDGTELTTEDIKPRREEQKIRPLSHSQTQGLAVVDQDSFAHSFPEGKWFGTSLPGNTSGLGAAAARSLGHSG